MMLNSERIGHEYPPLVYAVGREKIREYAAAVGDTEPLYTDLDAARAAGFADLVAPPMFAVVYAGGGLEQGLFDPQLGIDFQRVVHGAQEFSWPGPAVVAGDEITSVFSVGEIRETAGLVFYEFGSRSVNQAGATVCEGKWTIIVR
ncbi:MAG: MaoC family dehydratase N-terminal domain-containing protein [Solirubrobacterales bacterium]|nr:MaoC family dehydratase N-terminal domain-containing protein [Solirubrobacterales bacterium]